MNNLIIFEYIFRYVGEGMEEGEFDEALEDLVTLEDDYREISQSLPSDVEIWSLINLLKL